MKPQRKPQTPETHKAALVSGRRMNTEELAECEERLRKHPEREPTRKDLATIFRHCADRITEDAKRVAFRQNDPARAERYDFWRELIEHWRGFARKQFPNGPALPEMPVLIGNDFYALAAVARRTAADVLDGRKAQGAKGGKAQTVPVLDEKRQRVCVGGEWHDLSDEQKCVLSVLFKAKGTWVQGQNLAKRPDKTIKAMPKPVRRIIESRKGAGYGYRIPAFLPQ